VWFLKIKRDRDRCPDRFIIPTEMPLAAGQIAGNFLFDPSYPSIFFGFDLGLWHRAGQDR
jgi:hypothetical protein